MLLDGIADARRQYDDLLCFGEMLANEFPFHGEGRIGEYRLSGCIIVVHLPYTARLSEKTRFQAGFFDEFFIEILGFVQSCIATRFLCINIKQNAIVNGHKIPSS